MSAGASRFYSSINDAAVLDDKAIVGLFVYYLTVEQGEQSVSTKDVNSCFVECDLTPPGRTASYLSEGVNDGKFVKAERGYKLQRHYREELSKLLGAEKIVAQTSVELRKYRCDVFHGEAGDFQRCGA